MTDQTEVPGNPSDAYVEKQAERRSEAMGIGDRPSKYHQWVPGQGWVFFAEYDVSPGQQLANMTGQQRTNALKNGWEHQLAPDAQAVANQLGIKVGSAPAYLPQNRQTVNGREVGVQTPIQPVTQQAVRRSQPMNTAIALQAASPEWSGMLGMLEPTSFGYQPRPGMGGMLSTPIDAQRRFLINMLLGG